MLSKQMVGSRWVLAIGLLANHTMISASTSAVVKDSNDDLCISGSVNELRIRDISTVKEVTLDVVGTCEGGPSDTLTPSGVVNIAYSGTVDQGGTATINLDDYADIIAQIPFTLKASTPTKGKSTQVTQNTLSIIYVAPDPGDSSIPQDGVANDTFTYTISDASANPSKTAQVSIPVQWKDPDVTPPTDTCVNSATVKCKGVLTEWPAGTLHGVIMNAQQNHVWHFDYTAAEHGAGQFAVFDGELKIVSLSEQANDFTLDGTPCQMTQEVSEQVLDYAPKGSDASYQCPFEDGKRYYLNIKSTAVDGNGNPANDVYTLGVL